MNIAMEVDLNSEIDQGLLLIQFGMFHHRTSLQISVILMIYWILMKFNLNKFFFWHS